MYKINYMNLKELSLFIKAIIPIYVFKKLKSFLFLFIITISNILVKKNCNVMFYFKVIN